MNIYADVLDANDDLAAWEAAYNPSTYLTTSYRGKTWDYYGPASYDPTYQTLASPSVQGGVTNNQRLGVGSLFPYLDVGLCSAALRFYNSAEGTRRPGRRPLGHGQHAPTFQSYNTDGAQFANANGGMDLGEAGLRHRKLLLAELRHLLGRRPGLPRLLLRHRARTQNPNGTVNYVTIDGSLYDQLYLGTLSFAVSSVAAGQTATINAASVPACLGGATTYWMCDGQRLVSDSRIGGVVGTIGSTDPVSICVAGGDESQDSSPGALLACPAVLRQVPRPRHGAVASRPDRHRPRRHDREDRAGCDDASRVCRRRAERAVRFVYHRFDRSRGREVFQPHQPRRPARPPPCPRRSRPMIPRRTTPARATQAGPSAR